MVTREVKKDSVRLDDVVIEGEVGNITVAEIKHSKRIQKSATPKQDLSWYIKWIASAFIFIAVSIRSTGIEEILFLDVIFSWIGCAGWCYVGILWKDRALILLNAILALMLFGGIIKMAVSYLGLVQ